LRLDIISESLEKFSLTLGVRRTDDEEEGARFATNYYSDRVYTQLPDTYTVQPRTATLNSDEPTWTAGLDYEMNENVLLYGKVTRGYKAGSFNQSGVSRMTSEPEFVTNYEIGAKTDFMLGDMPARLNANLFSLDYEDIQRAAGDNFGIGAFQPDAGDFNNNGSTEDYVCIGPNGENFATSATCLDQGAIVFNADGATIEGIELEFLIQPTENLEISANYSYVDAQYDNYDLVQYPDPLKGGSTLRDCNGQVTVPSLGEPAATLDLSCIPFQNTPEDTAALNVRYLLPLGDGIGDVVLFGSVNYRGEVYGGATMHPDDEPRGWVDAYHVYNVSAEWNGIMGSSFDVRAFVNNVADDTYVLANYTGYANSSGFTNDMYGEPRMWGVSLRYRFGAEGG
jgi:iron complex outermembrane receptor protein